MDSDPPLPPEGPHLAAQPQNTIEKLESRRKRSRKACEPCRQRKRKCDGLEPCKTCVEFEYDCYFATSSKKRLNTGSERRGPSANSSASPVQQSVTLDSTITTNHQYASTTNDAQSIFKNTSFGDLPYSTAGTTTNNTTSADRALDHHPPSILDPLKIRYMSASSAVAFPRLLGLELNRIRAPRLHSFAWNIGLRREHQMNIWTVADLLPIADMRVLANIYFETVHPHLGFLSRATFDARVEARWSASAAAADSPANNNKNDPDKGAYDAVICGVAALGSFFSGSAKGHPQEQTLAEFAKSKLDDAPAREPLTTTHVAGSLLRSLYLRCTAKPSGAWIVACETMHFVEATGLHRATPSITVVEPRPPPLGRLECDSRRRLAWMAFLLGTLFAYEYGRSSVALAFNTKDPLVGAGEGEVNFPHDLLAMARRVPSDYESPQSSTESKVASLRAAFSDLLGSPASTEVRVLLKTDFVLAVFRRMRLLKIVLSANEIGQLLELGRNALSAARTLISQSRPWWMLASTTFQLVCVFLCLDTPATLSAVGEAVEILEEVKEKWDTHMNREAVTTAKLMVDMVKQKKEEGLQALLGGSNGALGAARHSDIPAETEGSATVMGNGITSEETMGPETMTFMEWPDFSFNWDTILDDEAVKMGGAFVEKSEDV